MGLREKKAEKVRAAIYEAMIALAERDGYEAATVEQVAGRAEVAVSTVHRYFANKDAILLDPIERTVGLLDPIERTVGLLDPIERTVGLLAGRLRARPEAEDVAVSLGLTVRAALDMSPEELARLRRLRAQLDRAPGLRARLSDLVSRERLLLEDAVAERSRRDQLWNAAAAHLTLMIVGMAYDHDRESLDETAPADYADRIITMLHAGAGAPIPTHAPRAGGGPAAAARALRAGLPGRAVLSSAEQHLLGDRLDRLADEE
ncbi:TetR/AcrR family transcriptional regulator [Streptomyces sp. 900105755]